MIRLRSLRRLVLPPALLLLALAPRTAGLGASTLAPSRVAPAPTLGFIVTSFADAPDAHPGDGVCADAAGRCTLRAAVQEGNAQPSGSTITIALPAGRFRLSLGTLALTAAGNYFAIAGKRGGGTVVDGAQAATVFAIGGGVNAALTSLTITGGNAGKGAGGGVANAGHTILSSLLIISNTAPMGDGGGIANAAGATLGLLASQVMSNTAPGGNGGGVSNSGTLTVRKSTISGNVAPHSGGGIDNAGTLAVRDSTINLNTSTYGGGIDNGYLATMTLRNSTVDGNGADAAGGGAGAGVYNDGTLTISGSTFDGNLGNNGAAVFNTTGPLIIAASAFTDNVARAGIGAIYNTGALTMTDSTLSGNIADLGAAGLYTGNGAALSYDTLAGNSGNLAAPQGTRPLVGVIIADSTGGPNCSGPIGDGGFNLDSGASCGFNQTTDLTDTNPLLGPLQNNGGLTQTMALQSGSPAIDHGGVHATVCPATDQRGQPRPDAGESACDMGAYESQGVG